MAGNPPALVRRAVSLGWRHCLFAWGLRERLPVLPIPLLGEDRAVLDLPAIFSTSYDRIAADNEAKYRDAPPPPTLSTGDQQWMSRLLPS